MHYSPDWEKSFENKFGDLLSLGSEPFNDTYVQLHVKPAIKAFIHSLLQAREEWVREMIESFRDDSKEPTETGLLIENILSRLTHKN